MRSFQLFFLLFNFIIYESPFNNWIIADFRLFIAGNHVLRCNSIELASLEKSCWELKSSDFSSNSNTLFKTANIVLCTCTAKTLNVLQRMFRKELYYRFKQSHFHKNKSFSWCSHLFFLFFYNKIHIIVQRHNIMCIYTNIAYIKKDKLRKKQN